jgi:hypothetical protein
MQKIWISPNRIMIIEQAVLLVADGSWKDRVIGYLVSERKPHICELVYLATQGMTVYFC